MLPIGGNYTVDCLDAGKASDLLQPKICISIHFNTFPAITCNPSDFEIELKKYNIGYMLLNPG